MNKKNIIKKLRHPVIFLCNISESNLEEAEWSKKYECFADIKPICDNKFITSENISFGHVITEEYFSFTIRFVDQITSNMRIQFNDKLFEIKRIININENSKFLKIIALAIGKININ